MNHPSLEQIQSTIEALTHPVYKTPHGKRAASVLIPLFLHEKHWSLVFMKRPDGPGPYGGQISFPGGRREPQDQDNCETAVRETIEEIGVSPEDIQVFGPIPPRDTRVSNYWIFPYVGVLGEDTRFAPNADEVERLLIVPLEHLLNPKNFAAEPYQWRGVQFDTLQFRVGKDLIWGLTARLLYDLFLILGCPPGNITDAVGSRKTVLH